MKVEDLPLIQPAFQDFVNGFYEVDGKVREAQENAYLVYGSNGICRCDRYMPNEDEFLFFDRFYFDSDLQDAYRSFSFDEFADYVYYRLEDIVRDW